MSKTVDERVVSMEFDNSNFEKNVSTSMSTLDKLKAKLNFKGTSDGLDEVSRAAKNVDMGSLSNSVQTVQAKFSALQVVAMTALANITNSVMNTATKISKAFTIEPILSGFQEYETQINSVQTILANTSSKGTTLDQVNAALDELNYYADKTIYNFTEMTRNIGTFTAAGVDLETSVSAIQGIANLAAVSGSTSQQASTAMYQLSQALAAGTVKLMDWNSVVNAGMGGEVFQNALKETARMHGIAIDSMIEEEGSFRETLQKGWLTSEILTETLGKFTKSGVAEYLAELTGVSQDQIEAAQELADSTGDNSTAYDELAKTMAATGKVTEDQAKEWLKMADTAEDAATKVKTFSQLWDTLKEAAQSGWTQSWEIIVGDFEEAKSLFTDLSDYFSNLIQDSSNARNTILSEALGGKWEQLTSRIEDAGGSTEAFETSAKRALENAGFDVDALISKYGSLSEIFTSGTLISLDGKYITASKVLKDAITGITDSVVDLSGVTAGLENGAAGDQVTAVQQALKSLGYDLGTFGDNVDGVDGKFGAMTKSAIEAFQAANDLNQTGIIDDDTLAKLNEATASVADLNIEYSDLIYDMSEKGGRALMIESITTTLNDLKTVLGTVKSAWNEIFYPNMSDDEILQSKAKTLYSVIEGVHSAVEKLSTFINNNLDKIKRTFKGLFAIVDIGFTLVKEFASGASAIFGSFTGFGGGILDATAALGDWLVALRDSIKAGDAFSFIGESMQKVADVISNFISAGTKKFSSFSSTLQTIGGVVSKVFGTIFDTVGSALSWIKENVGIGGIFAGLVGGGIFSALRKFSGILEQIQEFIKGIRESFKSNKEQKSGVSQVLDSLNESLRSFTEGIKVASLVLIAAALYILAAAIEKLSALDADDISVSLFAIAAAMKILTSGFRSIVKTLAVYKSTGTLKAAATMYIMAKAIGVLADAMVTLSGLSWDEIVKGLGSVGGLLLELAGSFRIISKGAGVNLRTSIAILAIAKACQWLADAMQVFSGMSWDEIGRGLSAMGGALGEVTAAVSVLGKFGGFGSLLGAIGILVVVQSLDEISENLEKLGALSWEEIGKGLSAMGGAFAELTAALAILSKVGGFGAILGSVAIFISSKSLDEISENLEKLGGMSWDEIGRGLSAMGGALAELAGASGILGKLAGFSGLLGSIDIVVISSCLGDLADAFGQFGDMSWDEIGRGLSAMGGALVEASGASGILGKLAGFSGLLGSIDIAIITSSLGDLADAFGQFGDMSWDEIGQGLAAMGGALGETGLAAALTGLAGISGLLGGGAILLTVQSLGDLADALGKFAAMSWDEISRGLEAMGESLGAVGVGALMNTFSGFGAGAISTVAGPLGELADSIKKWEDVEVPDTLGDKIASLAGGIGAFTFADWGADAIATFATPIGDLADSIKKWEDVTVPEYMGAKLASLAGGIKSFTFAGFGADAISAVATPLGDLATSVNTWSTVTIPDGLGDQLSELAGGVEAWTWAFVGDLSIAGAVQPLTDLAGAVGSWSSVDIPDNLASDLTDLANAVVAWSWAWLGDLSVDNAVQPLTDLAGAIEAWNGVTIPSGIKDDLTNLADGVKAWSWTWLGSLGMDAVAGPLGELGDSINKFNTVDIPTDLTSQLTKLSNSLKSFEGIDLTNLTGATSAAKNIQALSDALVSMNDINISSASNFVHSISILSSADLSSLKSNFSSAGSDVISGLSSGISSGSGEVTRSITTVLSSTAKIIKGKYGEFVKYGKMLMTKLASGITSGSGTVTTACTTVMTKSVTAIRLRYNAFKSAGKYLGEGLVNGIKAKETAVYNAAYALGQKAVQGEKDGQQSNSPSKETYKAGIWFGEGLVNGINAMGTAVYNAGSELADTGLDSISNAVSKVASVLSSDMDVTPRITPVVDLSNVSTGIDAMNSMFSNNPLYGAMRNSNTINRLVNARNQNGVNDDVVSAIAALGKLITENPTNSYTINGITYDDGSNINEAVRTLVRAARVERRM